MKHSGQGRPATKSVEFLWKEQRPCSKTENTSSERQLFIWFISSVSSISLVPVAKFLTMCVVEEFVYTPAGVLLLEEKFILVTVILIIGKHVETNNEKTKLGVVSANPQR